MVVVSPRTSSLDRHQSGGDPVFACSAESREQSRRAPQSFADQVFGGQSDTFFFTMGTWDVGRDVLGLRCVFQVFEDRTFKCEQIGMSVLVVYELLPLDFGPHLLNEDAGGDRPLMVFRGPVEIIDVKTVLLKGGRPEALPPLHRQPSLGDELSP